MMAECSVKDVRFGDRIKRAKRFEEAYGNDVSGNLEEVQKAYEEACRFFSRNSSGSTTSTTNNTKDGERKSSSCDRPTVVKVIEPSPRRKRLVGYIVEKKDNAGVTNTKKKNFQLQPTDSRMPTCDIDASLSELKDLENVPENVIVFASMVDVEGKARGAFVAHVLGRTRHRSER